MDKLKWEVVTDANDEKDNPTMWAMDVRGTEVEARINSRFIWISMDTYGTYAVEIDKYGMKINTLVVCKSLSSAKRWVTMNLL